MDFLLAHSSNRQKWILVRPWWWSPDVVSEPSFGQPPDLVDLCCCLEAKREGLEVVVGQWSQCVIYKESPVVRLSVRRQNKRKLRRVTILVDRQSSLRNCIMNIAITICQQHPKFVCISWFKFGGFFCFWAGYLKYLKSPFWIVPKKMSLHSCRRRPCRQSSFFDFFFVLADVHSKHWNHCARVHEHLVQNMLELRFVLVYSFCGQFQVAPGLDSASLSCHGFCVQITNFPTRHHHH